MIFPAPAMKLLAMLAPNSMGLLICNATLNASQTNSDEEPFWTVSSLWCPPEVDWQVSNDLNMLYLKVSYVAQKIEEWSNYVETSPPEIGDDEEWR